MTTLTSPGSPSNWDSSVTRTFSAYAKRWCNKNEAGSWKAVHWSNPNMSTYPLMDILFYLKNSMDGITDFDFVIISEDEFIEIRHCYSSKINTIHWKKQVMPK